ncbi:DUF2799 domain-containing protein [Parahaliea sp. F7430]|uniref:DUF2799 domain-containing protein n=1 Tax=Sediminihaliea albiluteola TaxID=2758564 RepID=A0A7W2TWB5_9GAMM|nr:DUF2799 domain-containing protein [Sediminihaliea albiluteola]MBA6413146.1 DUF2799 domain-containing protein [Sediminihaliea albiluteola]
MTADWHSIGYEDAARGEASTRMTAHREACAKHGITPEIRKYKRGHEEGLVVFCTGSSGYNRAQSGYQYQGICPQALEADFLEGYKAGREIYLVRTEVERLESRQNSLEQEQERIKTEIKEKEAELFDSDKTERQRRKIYQDISLLNERQGSLLQERDELIRKLSEGEAELRKLHSRSNYF